METIIDLDASPEAQLEDQARENLYVIFGLYYFLGRIDYSTWQKSVRFYAYHTYILPDERTLSDLLCDMIWKKHCRNAAAIYLFLTAIRNIEAHYTEQQQARMAGMLISPDLMARWRTSQKTVL